MFYTYRTPSIWFEDHRLDPRISTGLAANFEGEVTFGLWRAEERVSIGNFSSIGRGTYIFGGGNHHWNWATTWPIKTYYRLEHGHAAVRPEERPVTIGHDVWVGIRSTIMPGTSLGHGAVIGAGSVVSGEVPPYGIAVGNPARVVRQRFDDEVVARLLALEWWNWPIEKVVANADLLSSEPPTWPEELPIVDATTPLEFPPPGWRRGAPQRPGAELLQRVRGALRRR